MLRKLEAVLRTTLGLAFVFVYMAVAGTIAIIAARLGKTAHVNAQIRTWGKLACAVGDLRYTVEGRENARGGPYVVVSNHLSAFDVPLQAAAAPFPMRFLAKTELYRIPVFGSILRNIGMVEVNREAHAAAHRAINETVAHDLAEGASVWVYAEGTRSRDQVLRPFKKGAFHIAVASGLPILPAVVFGTDDAWPAGAKLIRGGHAKLIFLEPIETTGRDQSDITRLRDETRDMILKTLIDLGRTGSE